MARRHAGISSLQRHIDSSSSYNSLSTSLATQQATTLQSQLETFQAALSAFSTSHRSKILSNAEFRHAFSEMCASLGVDPLGGGSAGLWDKLGLSDWYYALGVQIVDVCLKARERGGGLIAIEEVISGVELLRNPTRNKQTQAKSTVTKADVKEAIKTLTPLGCGYAVIKVGERTMVRCAPGELDTDSLVVVEAASALLQAVGEALSRNRGTLGGVNREEVWSHTRRGGGDGWTMDRVDQALEKAVVADGLAWVDEQAPGAEGKVYWVPALFDFGGE